MFAQIIRETCPIRRPFEHRWIPGCPAGWCRKEMPPDMLEAMEQIMVLSIRQPHYLDLKTPWLNSPQ